MDLIKYNIKYAVDPNGLPNFGNSCFFNSLLQCILSCPSIYEVLDKPTTKKNDVGNKLLDLFKADETNIHYRCYAIWKSLMAHTIKRKDNTRFLAGMQHDAHEGLLLLLDVLTDIPNIKQLFEHRYRTEVVCADCKKVIINKAEDNLTFEVQPDLKTEQHEDFKVIDDYYNTSLPLNDFIRKQNGYIEDFKCTNCESKSPKFKTVRLSMIPEILPIMFKKYGKKVVTPFPGRLEFAKKGSNEKLIYGLVAQSEHSGSMQGGHYWATCLRKAVSSNALKWYTLNDSSVDNGVPGPTANTYIAFYHYITTT